MPSSPGFAVLVGPPLVVDSDCCCCCLRLSLVLLGLFLTLSQVTNFRDHDARDRLRDTKACQKESFYAIICII